MSGTIPTYSFVAAIAAIDAKIAAPDNAASRMVAHHALIQQLVSERPRAPGPAIAAGLAVALGCSFTSSEKRAIAAYARGHKSTNTKKGAKEPKPAADKANPIQTTGVVAVSSNAVRPVASPIDNAALAARAAGGPKGMVFRGHGQPVRDFFSGIEKATVEAVVARASAISRDPAAMADVETLEPYDRATVWMFIDAAASSAKAFGHGSGADGR